MGRTFALTMQLPKYRSAQEIRQSHINIRPEKFGLPLLVILVLFTLSYLFLVNSFATAGYQINKLQTTVKDLQDQYKKLQITSAQLQSIQTVQSDPTVLQMIPVTAINYVQSTSLTQR